MPSSHPAVFSSVSANAVMRRHNVSVIGEGPTTLVFGHGFGCDQQIWQHVAPAFQSGYKVVLFDYVGCGHSDLRVYNKEHYHHLQAYADDLVTICTELALDNIYFVGHSVSGAIAMLASISTPGLFQKIIAIGPSPRYLNDLPDYVGGFDAADISALLDMMERNYFEWTDYLAPKVIGSPDDTEHINELKLSFLRADPVISKTFASVTFYSDIRAQLPEITVPVTVLYCSEDIIVPLEVIDFMQQNIPRCRVIALDASGHYPQLINPAAVIRAVEKEIAVEA